MTPRNLGEVLLKVWGVTLLVGAALRLPTFLSHASIGSDHRTWRIAAGWTLVHLLLTAIAGIALLKFAGQIAERLTPPAAAPEAPLVVPSLDGLGFGLLGAYLSVAGLRDLVSAGFQLATKPRYETEALAYLWRQSAETVLGAAVQTAAGIALLFWRLRVTTLLRTIRATPKPHNVSSEQDAGDGPTNTT